MAFVGVGNYLWHPAAISTLSEKYPDKRGFAIAIHAMGPNVGGTLTAQAVVVTYSDVHSSMAILLATRVAEILSGTDILKLVDALDDHDDVHRVFAAVR